MSTTNNNTTTPITADNIVCEKLGSIKSEIDTATSNETTKSTLQECKEESRGYKLNNINKAKDFKHLYEDVLSFVALGNLKKTGIIKASVNTYAQKDVEIENFIKEVSKSIKSLKEKTNALNVQVCKTYNQITEDVIPNPPHRKTEKVEEVVRIIYEMKETVMNINKKTTTAYESSITIAGVQTYTNTSSLNNFASQLETVVKDFRMYIDENVASTTQDVSTGRQELNTVLEELSKIICEKNSQNTLKEGITKTKQFACEGTYNPNIGFTCSGDLKEPEPKPQPQARAASKTSNKSKK